MPGDVDRGARAVILFTFDHTSRVDQVFKARLEGVEPAYASTVAGAMPNLGALSETLARTDGWYVNYARRATPAELATLVEFTFVDDGAPGRMSKGDMLAHVITHGASHRGAIGKMLETLKLPGAPDMVTTFRRRCAPA